MAFHFFTVLVSFTVCYCLYTLFMGMKKTRDNQKKNRIKYILFGLGLSSFLISLNILPVSGFNVYPMGNFSFIPAIVLAFGVLKYDLLDMGAVIRRGTIYFLLTIVLTLFYVLIIAFFNALFIRSGQTHPLLMPFVLALFMVILFNPIREKVRVFIDQLFFRGKYDYQRLLKEVSAQMTTLLRIDEVTELLLRSVEETLQTDHVELLVFDEKSSRFQVKQLGGNVVENSLEEIDREHPLVVYLEGVKRPLSAALVERSGLSKHEKETIIHLIRAWRSSLVVPMYSKGKLVGILDLGQKKSGELFVHEDMELLSTLANQSATALDNAKMYNELEKLNQELERKVEERTADLRQALAEKERTQKQLIQSESLAAIGQLVAGTAHELNNPLASAASLLQNSTETIRDWPETFKEREEVIDDLTFSLKELKRAGDIVKSLLGLSRQTQTYVEPVNINVAIDDALRVLHNQFKTLPISIEKDYEEALPPVEGNFANLGQVFINIIKNALRHPGKTANIGKQDAYRLISWIHVAGVPLQFIEDRFGHKLFEPFFDIVFLHLGPEFRVVKGLGQKPVDPCVYGLNGAFHRGITGQDDPCNFRIESPDFDKRLQAIEPRHLEIGDDCLNIAVIRPHKLDGLLSAFRQKNRVLIPLEDLFQRSSDAFLIIHNQDDHPSLLLQGSSITKTDPFPGSVDTETSPPCRLIISWEMYNPNPVPFPTGFDV